MIFKIYCLYIIDILSPPKNKYKQNVQINTCPNVQLLVKSYFHQPRKSVAGERLT